MNFYSGVRTNANGSEVVQIKQIDEKYYVVSNGEVWGPKMKKPDIADTVFLKEKFKISNVIESTEEAYQAAIDKAVDLLVPVYVSKYDDVIATSTAVETKSVNLKDHKSEIMGMKRDVDFVISGENKVRQLAFAKAKKVVTETLTENVNKAFGKGEYKTTNTTPKKAKLPQDMTTEELTAHEISLGKKYPEPLRSTLFKLAVRNDILAGENVSMAKMLKQLKSFNSELESQQEETVTIDVKDENGKVIGSESIPVSEYNESLKQSVIDKTVPNPDTFTIDEYNAGIEAMNAQSVAKDEAINETIKRATKAQNARSKAQAVQA